MENSNVARKVCEIFKTFACVTTIKWRFSVTSLKAFFVGGQEYSSLAIREIRSVVVYQLRSDVDKANKTVLPLAIVGSEMIIAGSAISTVSYSIRTRKELLNRYT